MIHSARLHRPKPTFRRLPLAAALSALALGMALRAEISPLAPIAVVAALPAAGDAPRGPLGGELPTGLKKSDDACFTPPFVPAALKTADGTGAMGGFNVFGAQPAAAQDGSSWRLPVPGYITSPFGKVRMLPVYRYKFVKVKSRGHLVQKKRRYRVGRRRHVHKGIDLKAHTGDLVKAVAAGTVAYAGQAQGYGWCVYIDHPGGLQTRYAHASQLLVQTGDPITAGEAIARAGTSGRSTGPHLHFEIRRDGEAINPLPYLEEAKVHEEEGGEGDDSGDSGGDAGDGAGPGVIGGLNLPERDPQQ